ncbi:MAG: M24 family metallopeptidase [Lachnospiraceae bacterium]
MREARIENVVRHMKAEGVSQLLISDPVSIYYLTGKYEEPGERFYALYLTTDGQKMIFMNHMFIDFEAEGIRKVWYGDTDAPADLVRRYLNPDAILGVDKNLPARFLLPMQESKAAAGFVNASVCVDAVRAVKEPVEQNLMADVSHINDLAMEEFKKLIVSGVTEKEVAEQMLGIYRALGAEDHSFTPIVAFGANAASSHHMPDDTVLQEGDCVLYDVGCRKDMYCADMTRTFFYSSVSAEHERIYQLVKQANEAAIAKLAPGIPLSELDKAARDVIAEAGYGDRFTHRLGHFIGLDVHEAGDVSAANTALTQPGMIFSIEPGIYLEGDVGVRIEDLVMITQEGGVRLNQYSKELEVLGGGSKIR